MTIKGKRATITPEGRVYIFERALQLPPVQRTKLAESLQRELNTKGLDVPEVEVLERMISKARNHPHSPLDEQWSIGCLAQHDIPPEALPAVIYIYEKRQRAWKIDFTIREVLWIARLCKTIDDLDFLERFASAYALRDKIDWILSNPVNTRGFDFMLLNYCNPERRDEISARLEQFPGSLNPFPSFHLNDSEEITEKLKQKGYDIKTPGMELLIKHAAEVKKQAAKLEKQARVQLEQKKPGELTKQETQYLKYLKAKEAQHERVNQRKE